MGDYSKLAAVMGTHEELAIFRQFSALNTKNLLYMQSELVHLECELASIASEDKCSADIDRTLFHVSLFDLKESSGSNKGVQWGKILEIREKLKIYSTSSSLLQREKADIATFTLKTMLFYNTPRSKNSRDQTTSM